MKQGTEPGRPLLGRKVLIVEDQYLIADEMRRLVTQMGGEVMGPAANLLASRQLMDTAPVDLALLDINLDGEEVYAVASELRSRGVPMIFATGYEASAMPDEFRGAPHLGKPVVGAALAAAIGKLGLGPASGDRS